LDSTVDPGLTNVTFNANGPYQPLTSGATTQPHYYDTLQAIYNVYRVLATSISVEIKNNVAGIVDVALFPSNVVDNPTSFAEASSRRASRIMTLNTAGVAGDLKVLSHSLDVSRFIGLYFRDLNCAGYGGALPTNLVYWCLFLKPRAAGLAANDHVRLKIVWDVLWSDLKSLDDV
jgi:hypothetical protein